MASFWGSAFQFPNNQLFSQTYQPWFHNPQPANPPVWPLRGPCGYSQYQQPSHAIISSLESLESSTSSDAEEEPIQTPVLLPAVQRPLVQTHPRPNAGNQRQPNAQQQRQKKKPQSAPTRPPISPSRSQLTRVATLALDRTRGTPAAEHTDKDLRQFLSQTPSTFSVVSTSTLKRERPPTWRSDYLPPSASWIKRRLLGLRMIVTNEPAHPSQRLILNSLLSYPSPPPSNYYFDLRYNPFSAYLLHLPHSNGPINQLHLLQLGTVPPTHDLRLWHQRLPWTIIVRSSHSNGILVSDILGNVYSQLMMPIVSQDYYNIDMTAEDRERVETAYKVRCNGDIGLLRSGILRMDFLGSHVGFLGIVRSWNGMWEIRTVDIHDVPIEL